MTIRTIRCHSAAATARRGTRPLLSKNDIAYIRNSQRASYALHALQSRFGNSGSHVAMLKLFRALDADGDGFITADDLHRISSTSNLDLAVDDVHALMGKLDEAQQGSVDIAQFSRALARTPEPTFLDQMQRTLIGVTRDGGSVYKSHASLLSTPSTASSSIRNSGNRVVSVLDATRSHIALFQPPSGRLNNFYSNLSVPKRNLPWTENTTYVTHPSSAFPNAHSATDSTRLNTVYRSMSVGSIPDEGIPHIADKLRQQKHRSFNEFRQRNMVGNIDRLGVEREESSFAKDAERIKFKSECIADYHNRVHGRMCHVL